MFTAGGGDALLVTAGGIGVRVNDLTAATTRYSIFAERDRNRCVQRCFRGGYIDVEMDPSPRASCRSKPHWKHGVLYRAFRWHDEPAANGLKIMPLSQANTYLDNGNFVVQKERHVDAGSLSVAAGTTIAGVLSVNNHTSEPVP
jgi:hypothetical protein